MDNNLDKKENIEERKISFSEKLSLKIRKGFIGDKTRTILLVVVLILGFVVINMWAQNQDLAQLDITESKIYTLTQTSKDAIKDITDEVNIYVYGYDENHAYVNFIKQYCGYNSNIKCEIVTESTHYDIITSYNMGTYNEILVVANGKDVALFPDYTFQTTEYINGVAQSVDITEQSITNAIVKVTDPNISKVYFVAGHGEFGDSELTGLTSSLETAVYEYEFFNLLSVTQIPDDCDVLAILAPDSDYTASEAEVIKNYVNNGGDVLIAMTTVDKNTDFTNLQTVLDLFAVKIEDGILYEGNSNNCMSVQGTSIPIVLLPNYSYETTITSEMDDVSIFSVAQSITINSDISDEMNISYENLIYTSSNAYNVIDYSNGFNLDGLEENEYVFGRKITKSLDSEDESKISELIIVGNDTFLADYDSIIGDYPIGYIGNNEFVMNCFANLTEKTSNLEILKNIDLTTFTSTTKQDNIVQVIVFVTPILIILAGIIISVIRKRIR